MKKRNSNSGRLKERGRENKWGGGEWSGGREREREKWCDSFRWEGGEMKIYTF